ncbi:hypothetical protein KM043_018857, partial [Ampulex compressa]
MEYTITDNNVYGAKDVGYLSTGPVSGGKAGPAGSSSYDRETLVMGVQVTASNNTTVTETNISRKTDVNPHTNSKEPKVALHKRRRYTPLEQDLPTTNIPRFLTINRTTGNFNNISPFIIDTCLSSAIGPCKNVKKIHDGLLVETLTGEQSLKLLKLRKFHEFDVEVIPHATLNHSKGVITCSDLLNCSEDEILQGLKPQGIINVKRILSKREGTLVPTASHILTFNKDTLPKNVKAGFHHLTVKPYFPPPMRCYNCQRYGHTATRCTKSQICICGNQLHQGTPCPVPIICIHCNGNHPASSRLCPAYKEEAAIQRIKTLEKLSYVEAKRKVRLECPKNRNTYATVTANEAPSTSRHIENIIEALTPKILSMMDSYTEKLLLNVQQNVTHTTQTRESPKTDKPRDAASTKVLDNKPTTEITMENLTTENHTISLSRILSESEIPKGKPIVSDTELSANKGQTNTTTRLDQESQIQKLKPKHDFFLPQEKQNWTEEKIE